MARASAEKKSSPVAVEKSEETKGPLDHYFDTPGFNAFINELAEFDDLDASGETPEDNKRIAEIFRAFEHYPVVVEDLQKFWQQKSQERGVILSPESLKKIETSLMEQINLGNLEIVWSLADQIAEYNELPEKIKEKEEQIDALASKHGSKDWLRRERRKGQEESLQFQEKLEGLAKRREAKDVLDDNETVLKRISEQAELLRSQIIASQMEEVWIKLQQNPDLLISVIDSAEGHVALGSIKKRLEKIGNPAVIIEQIKKDQALVGDAEAAGRAAANLGKLLEVVKTPEIQKALSKFLAEPSVRRGIEDSGPSGASPSMLANRELRNDSERLLNFIKTSEVKKIAMSPEQMQLLLGHTQELRGKLGDSQFGQVFERLNTQVTEGIIDLNQFDEPTLKQAQKTFSILGLRPGIAISEFFTKRNKKSQEKKAEKAHAHIQTIENAEFEKAQLELKHEQARADIFSNLPFANELIKDIGKEVDKKFEQLLADTASLKDHFEAGNYFDSLVAVDSADDDFDITENMLEVSSKPGRDTEAKKNESKKALKERVRQRTVKDMKEVVTGLSLDKINRGSLRNAFGKIRAGIGEPIISSPVYKELELEAITAVSKDASIPRAKRKQLENFLPKLKDPNYLGVAA